MDCRAAILFVLGFIAFVKAQCPHNLTVAPSNYGKTFYIVGHAGGDPINHCENTIEATKSAIESGANAIELDLSLSFDGVIFLWHDPEPWSFVAIVRRLGLFLGDKLCYPSMDSGKKSKFLTFESIRKSWFHGLRRNSAVRRNVTTLDEWFRIFGSEEKIKLYWFDYKDAEDKIDRFVFELKRLLRKYRIPPHKMMVSSSDRDKGVSLQDSLRAYKLPQERVTVDTTSWLPFVPSFLKYDGVEKSITMCGCCANLGLPRFALNSHSATTNIVSQNVKLRDERVRNGEGYVDIFVWTIDDLGLMNELLALRVNGIITNRPGLLHNTYVKYVFQTYSAHHSFQ